jgi:hypothetical protein
MHEPCWYAVRSKGHWTGDRKQTTLWNIRSGGQDTETDPSTQKPVECMRRPMQNNSSPGQAVYDPFLGSGTTLIAAETVGRVCLAMDWTRGTSMLRYGGGRHLQGCKPPYSVMVVPSMSLPRSGSNQTALNPATQSPIRT